MKPTLLVLAAGMGSRYGGLKQLDAMGPSGETILEYSAYDAWRAGFGKVVFIIRPDFAEAFDSTIIPRIAPFLPVETVFQTLDTLPAGFEPPAERVKPWGTGHALWCAHSAIREPFGVINADDFYGREAFSALADFWKRGAIPDPDKEVSFEDPSAEFAMVGYRLSATLSDHGSVSRGVCRTDAAQMLVSVTELTRLSRTPDGGAEQRDAYGEVEENLTGKETVSVNFWGFTPAVFTLLETRLTAFLERRAEDPKAEFYIPSAVTEMIDAKEAVVTVLPAEGSWFGVTYREDRPIVQAAIADLVAAGAYPTPLTATF